jgi:hypothetical protein
VRRGLTRSDGAARATPDLMRRLPNHSDPALQQWQCWYAAKTQAERSQHTTRLWHLCTPVIFAALRNLVEELSGRLKRHVSVHDWLQRHNMEKEDAFSAAWLGVERAAKLLRSK